MAFQLTEKKPQNKNKYFPFIPGYELDLGGAMVWENRFLVIDPTDADMASATTKTIKVIANGYGEARNKACDVIDLMLARYARDNGVNATIYGRLIETKPAGFIFQGEINYDNFMSNTDARHND